jgi:TP901 family phage tail tape measure protein
MARTITDEKIKLSIIVDGNPAQKELFELEKSIRDLNTQQKELRKEKQLLEKQGLKDTERYKAVTASIKENSLAITASKTKMAELQNQIGLTGLTMGQLQQKSIALKAALRAMIPGSENYKNTQAELGKVTARLDELRGKAAGAKFSIGSLADSFNRYQGIAISVIAAMTGVILSIQKIIDINGKLSDAQSDVMKTTGMTKKEVDELTKSFGMLETRTSRIDLLKIAEQGGRLGIPKAEIQDFVQNMNMAAVALGDSFTGGVDEVAEKLGKIKFLFKETKDMNVAQAYQSIGSAINDLGANGTANEANIAEFTQRIGSLTDVLKPTVQETLALGTAFEESGIEAEQSSRAYNIFMKQASTEAGKFATVMGISKKSVEDMINTNPLNFMLEFSKGLNGMNATEVANTLDYLGVNADGANKVIGAMGNNFDRFHTLIDLSNNSFENGTSLINEYNIKNENLAATLEKISKRISGFFSSEAFINWLGGAVSWFAKFIGAADDADGSVTRWRNTLAFTAKVIGIVTAAIITNVGWQKLVALWTTRNTEANMLYILGSKARAFADGVTIITTQALAAAQMLLSGNLKGAAQAFRVMTATMMTTPWGFILGALAAIGTAYVMFSKEAKAAVTAQTMMADTARQTDDLVKKESQTFMSLIAIIKDTKASTEARTEALKKAKEIGGEYTTGLTLENATTLEGTKMINAYIRSLQVKMQLQVLEAKQRELLEQIQDRKNKKLSEETDLWDQVWALTKNFGNQSGAATDVVLTAVERRKTALDDLQEQLKFTNAEMKAFLEKNPNLIKTVGGNSGGGPNEGDTKMIGDVKYVFRNGKWVKAFSVPGADGNSNKDSKKSEEEINKLRLDNESKFQAELLRLKRQGEDEQIAMMQDGYEKEMAVEALRYKREIEDLEKQKVHKDEMSKLDADIAKAKQDKDTRYYDFLVQLKEEWKKRNSALDDEINKIEEGKLKAHKLKMATIQENGAKTEIQKQKEEFDRAKVIRETKFQEELAALGDNVKAKEKLTREHQQSELDIEQKYLEDLVQKFNDIVGKGSFNKIDLDLLSPEQVEYFKAEAEKLGLTLAELINKRNELMGKQQSNAQALGVANTSADILGFTSENWDTFFGNLSKGKAGIDEMVFAVSALTTMYSAYSDFLTANENNQLRSYQKNSDAKKKKLKQQLDSGMINQHQYKVGIEKIDDDLEKKKADLDYKQAKRQKAIAAMNIITSTAQAIIGIWAQFPKFDFGATAAIMSGVVGALGALQLATVLSTPLPAKGAEKGLYPDYVKREQDGKIFRTTGTSGMKTGLYSKPRLLVGEGPGDMPEMVIDKRSYAQLSPYTKSLLVRELSGVRGFENGYYNEKSMRYEVPSSGGASAAPNANDQYIQLLLGVVAENTAVMKDLRDQGVVGKFFRNDLQSMRELDKGLKDYSDLKNKAKK